MPTTVQFRRGTTAQNNAFTGATGEISVDSTDGRLVVHDGSTAGGSRQALASETIFRVIADDSTGIYLQGGTDELRISGGNGIVTSTDSGGSLTVALNASDSATFNGGVVVDNITIDGTEIDLSSGDLTVDVAGDIILDAGGDEIIFKDGSTNVGHVSMDSDNLTIKSLVADKDIIFQGNDDSSAITALTLDMSAAGAAAFNSTVTATGFIIGSADINEADLEQIDGLTAGTVAASKAVVVDSNKDAGDFRNVTLSGTLHTTTLDVREILSTDSTFITVNEGLEVLGTIQCNEITSSDSSEVTINNLRTQVITANDSTEILVNDAMRVSGLITGTATQAQYADLAEIFATDDLTLQPGDVVHFSGNKKIGLCDQDAHSSVAGVISTEPGFLLNEGGNGVKLAMTGRVPCKVQGIVDAGDLLVSAGNGRARTEANPAVGTVIGKAIESHNSTGNGVIDIMVTLM